MSSAAPVSNVSSGRSRHVLDPVDRVSEVLFGLIMVLTFTGSLSAAEAGRTEIREMLIGALGCNVAWGIIDGIMYLMACLADKRRDLLTVLSVRATADPQQAQRHIADALPPSIASIVRPAELEAMRHELNLLPEPPHIPRLGKDDWLGALGVFFLVFLSTFPVVIPFFFAHDAPRALRFSNGIAIALLFLTGYSFGRAVGYRPWRTGLSMVVVGSILVAMTIALGG